MNSEIEEVLGCVLTFKCFHGEYYMINDGSNKVTFKGTDPLDTKAHWQIFSDNNGETFFIKSLVDGRNIKIENQYYVHLKDGDGKSHEE